MSAAGSASTKELQMNWLAILTYGRPPMFRAILAISPGMLLVSNVQAAEGRHYGQAVSHCNQLANAQKVKGQACKEVIDLCTARATGGPGRSAGNRGEAAVTRHHFSAAIAAPGPAARELLRPCSGD